MEIQKLAMLLCDLDMQFSIHQAETYHRLACSLSFDELSDAERRDLAFSLHFDLSIDSDVVVWLLRKADEPYRVNSVLEWLRGEAKQQQIKAYREMPYADYLKTEHWQAVRRIALVRDGGRCRVCNSPDSLNVHHRTYERRGEEIEDDVTTLCQPCHELFHANGKLARPE